MTATFTKINTKIIAESEIVQILLGIGLLFGCSQVSIPLQPVPITLQTVAVMLIGLFYSRNIAFKTVFGYLALGAFGVPVFANMHGGLPALLGPTGGYLAGYLAAVTCMTLAREKILKDTYLSMTCNCLLGTAIIYVLGVSWLSFFVGANNAIQFGLVPFIVTDSIKAVILCAAVRFLKK